MALIYGVDWRYNQTYVYHGCFYSKASSCSFSATTIYIGYDREYPLCWMHLQCQYSR